MNIELQSVENTFHSINQPSQTKIELGSASSTEKGEAPGDSPPPRFGFNKAYIFTGFREGFVRAVLTIVLTGGWISAACIPKDRIRFDSDNNGDLKSAQIAYLVFVLFTYITSIIIYVLNLFNLITLPLLSKVPWALVTIVCDGIGLLGVFSVSVAAASIESQLSNNSYRYIVVNQGAFAACALFGFLSTICLIVLVVTRGLKMRAERFTLSSK